MTHEEYVQRLKNYNINIKVIGQYQNCYTKLAHECPICHRTDWMVKPQHVWDMRATKCNRCAGRNEWDENTYKELLKTKGIKMLGKYVNTRVPVEHECPVCHKQNWMVRPGEIINRDVKQCIQCFNATKKAHSANSYRLEVKKLFGIKVIGDYVNNYTAIAHECPICHKQDWLVAPHDMLRRGTHACSSCTMNQMESSLAYSLKQVALHEYKNTIVEYDAGFRGPNGGKSCYDIYIPELNLLIECQSIFHYTDKRREIDILKKKYAIDNNYNFIEFDSNKNTLLEAIQYIAPHLTEVPEYIDLSLNIKSRFIMDAQRLLDNGYSKLDIADMTGYSIKTIDIYISKGKLHIK